ncbi:hypothetical protein K435DRAFT_796431 [Dendrothele bispora CBS 962.96]|uniref:RNase H type-1 domain-containing protein n=1 Tax=Dendrothele bispora (strain CBS 962.96) TaxID=1314807 RepID=A0A4S8M5P2_DENBC|nr:hypothetical protein K435DRAFT_796431 [Dendrothele bispora CBS 962.96]
MSMSHLPSRIENRLLKLCRHQENSPIPSLTGVVNDRFVIKNCRKCRPWSYEEGVAFKAIFTDGSCKNHGLSPDELEELGLEPHARYGVAASPSMEEDWQVSRFIDDEVDPCNRRTSQRAELLGVLAGLEMFMTLDMDERLYGEREDFGWVICTDSECVVKGITKYYSAWRANGWMKLNSDTPPADLDLFHELDATLRSIEECGISVGLGIPRQHNQLAHKLATRGSSLQVQVNIGKRGACLRRLLSDIDDCQKWSYIDDVLSSVPWYGRDSQLYRSRIDSLKTQVERTIESLDELEELFKGWTPRQEGKILERKIYWLKCDRFLIVANRAVPPLEQKGRTLTPLSKEL